MTRSSESGRRRSGFASHPHKRSRNTRRRRGGALGACLRLRALGVAGFLCQGAICASPTWYFLPTGKDARADLAGLAADFDRTGWRKVAFPHSFDAIQADDNVFGWYVSVLPVPASLRARDLILDLGVIDDSDVTFFNGKEVGRMGAFSNEGKSAWNLDRRYRVPCSLVEYGEPNVIAVQVKDFGGIGGILGQPVVGALLGSEQGQWTFQYVPAAMHAAAPEGTDGEPATPVSIPDTGLKKRVPHTEGYAVYTLDFSLDPAWAGRPCVLDLGPVYDACEIHLNGSSLGRIGRLPPGFIPASASRARVFVPRGILRKTNTLSVRVYWRLSQVPKDVDPTWGFAESRARGGAGLPGYPVLDFSAPADAADAARLGPAAALDFADLCLSSNRNQPAASALSKLSRTRLDAHLPARLLDLRVRLKCAEGQAEQACSLFRQFVSAYPQASLSLPTSYLLTEALAKCPALDARVAYLGQDRGTCGDWRPLYGNYGYILCGYNGRRDLTCPIWPGPPFEKAKPGNTGYAVRIMSETDYARAWIGATKTKDPRALCVGTGKTLKRRYSCWDDHGEVHPFDERGPDLFVDLDVPKGQFVLSFYLLDYDWYNGEHPRIQSLLLLDRESKAPLALAPSGRFGEGLYERFYVKGPRKITARINKHRSACAVVSGVFLDRVPGTGRARETLGRGGSDPRINALMSRLRAHLTSAPD